MPKRACTRPIDTLAFREWSLELLADMGFPREVLETHKLFDAEVMAQRLKNHDNSWPAAGAPVHDDYCERLRALLEKPNT